MARTRTVDFLPEIFQTPANKQFLSATLDQLVQEPQFKKTQGFVGRRIGPGVNPNDSYVIEQDAVRANYQLEPGVVKLSGDRQRVLDAITYPGLTDALAVQGAPENNPSRQYTSDYYTWDPFVDFDKFVNFSQYYWLPNGPASVDVSATQIPTTDEFVVSRSSNSYTISGYAGSQPLIYLVRGGTYQFQVDQPGNPFWIQTAPGISGTLPGQPNISSRVVDGVANNGQSVGTVTFTVPDPADQEFYYNLPDAGSVDLITDLKFNQINNVYLDQIVSQYGGIDGITSLEGRSVIFMDQSFDAEQGGWLQTTLFDPLNTGENNQIGSFDTTTFDQVTEVGIGIRWNVWRINYNTDSDGRIFLTLTLQRNITNLNKITILFGNQYSSTQWYKTNDNYFLPIPALTAVYDTLYYQDGANPDLFGIIKLVTLEQNETLFVNNILGQQTYTSPNGVVFTNNLKVSFRGSVEPAEYLNQTFYVAGVGRSIKLLPIENYVTPETYINTFVSQGYDTTLYDADLYDQAIRAPLTPDYIVMALDSPDLNAWARGNRWFHIDVITATADYNNTEVVIDNNFRGRRPILEFRPGLKLFNSGTEFNSTVDVVDFTVKDALSLVNGTTGFGVDGYIFESGDTVIFAGDDDISVRNRIYRVDFITPSSAYTQPIINLVPVGTVILANQTVLSLNGLTAQGKTYVFDGATWILAQQKTSLNQAPLFDVLDKNGISFGDKAVYPGTTFAGSKLFSYAQGSGQPDAVLGFALKYLSLANVGDIVFDNNLYTDTFLYVRDSTSYVENISQGFVREYLNRVDYTIGIGWQNSIAPSVQYQQFNFVYTPREPLILDVAVNTDAEIPAVKIFVGSEYQTPGSYSITVTDNSTFISLASTEIPAGQRIEVLALSDQTSAVGFYQVPINLENNPLNENSSRYTLGTVRAHYQTIAQNLNSFAGSINGANNTRDLGNLVPYGLKILQQSSPLTLAGYFLRSQQYNIFSSLEYNSREYEKFKAQLLATAVANDYGNLTISETLNAIIADITLGKTDGNPFYWSDMLPTGSVYTQTQITVTPITSNVFDTLQVYNFESSNYLGLLVYVNDQQLVRDVDYTVAIDGPRITILSNLNIGDVVTIREYQHTYGNFVPNTPTKLGLYPAFIPEIYVDETYIEPTAVIRGHDGSITIAFNDFRDELLLEFERRIYNNLKLDNNPIPLTLADVVPGQFRTTDYSLAEINNVLGQDFLSWIGWNKLDYKAQTLDINNQFTYNYSQAQNKLDGQPLTIGAWRGLYTYFYDTIYPNSRPWEMLGISEKPTWWESEYGPAPYTSGNLVLWDDLAQGLVKDPAGYYTLSEYARPELAQVIPAGSEGQLLSPFESLVGNYARADFRKSWTVGDDGPVENSWRNSSSYPFAVMRLLALTRPAEFFSLFADRDLYKYDADLDQYLYNGRYRLDATGVEIYGNGQSKASYINWIVDYNRQLGINSTSALTDDLKSLDVRLCYRMGAFSAKNLLQIYTEKSSPDSTNSGLLLPDESYNLLLYKNVPFDTLTYSSVIVQKTDTGYAVYGYGTVAPYFNILVSRPSGLPTTISAGGISVRVSTEHTNQVVQVPYGYVFKNETMVADFLISYGALLGQQGLIFQDVENGYVLNWQQMVAEFLYWSTQGWTTGSLINLNPGATKLLIERPQAIVDNISLQTQENLVLNQERRQLSTKDLIIDRQDNRFSIATATAQTINYVNLKFVSYEHMVVLDNRSIFADLIFDPVTAARQSRVKIVGATTIDWNGQLNAPGFILNQDNIEEWKPLKKYVKGEIVKYKNLYYSATSIVEPSDKFDYNLWTRSDFTKIQQGLLPNLANKSDELTTSYSIYTANLERDQDLFSFGLIGFRPREYMTALNLDDVSQVNLYRQFLGTKGTLRAVELFSSADLGRGNAEFNIYENWAVQKAVYGANANRSYYELQLNEALLDSNPSLVEVVQPEQSSQADQTVLVNNIWKKSYNITSPDILTTTLDINVDQALPTAGYVNFDDVDIRVFDIDDPTNLNPYIDSIGIGTKIWVAKINSYDWGVYRSVSVPSRVIAVSDNLNSTSNVVFNSNHGLTKNQIIIIRFFDDEINGVYRVLNVVDSTTVSIAFTFTGSDQIVATGQGVAFTLETMRVAQPSDVINLPYANDLIPGSEVWVDKNAQGLWQVLQKQEVFNSIEAVDNTTPVANSNFGASAAQSKDNLFAIIGSPEYSSAGAFYTFVRTNEQTYAQNSVQSISAPAVAGVGQSVVIGNDTFIAVGAPTSGTGPLAELGYVGIIYRNSNSSVFDQTALLVPPAPVAGAKFGQSLAMSPDEKWLYIGAPGEDKVYAYGLVNVENQLVNYITDGLTSEFNFTNSIKINSSYPDQLSVILNNVVLKYGVDYVLTPTSVEFVSTPPNNLPLTILRRNTQQLDYSVYNNVVGSTSGAGVAATFRVINQRGSYLVGIVSPGLNYNIGDTITISATDIANPDTTPTSANDLIVTVTGTDTSGEILSITYTGSGINNSSLFSLQPYLYTATNDYSFSLAVNGEFQRLGIDYTFDELTFTVNFINNPVPGANILVRATNYYQLVETIAGPTSSMFGHSVSCTTDGSQILIGAPVDQVNTVANVGSVYVYDRSVQRFIVNNVTQTSYIVNGTINNPALVTLNGNFLIDSATNVVGDYSVSGNTINFVADLLNVGDKIEISTNEFNLLQQVTDIDTVENSEFGFALDICTNNCSLYIGAPGSSAVAAQAGSVIRYVNQSRVYDNIISTLAPTTLTVGDTLRINNIEIAVPPTPNNTVAGLVSAINAANIPNVVASSGATGTINSGKLMLTVKNRGAGYPALTVLPGAVGTAFYDLDFKTFVYTQTISAPVANLGSRFGTSVIIDTSATNLVVGSPKANIFEATTFDAGETYFDARSTTVSNTVGSSGVVYSYDLLPSSTNTIDNPGKFVFGQQIFDQAIQTGDQYGTAIDYTNNILLATAPGYDNGAEPSSELNTGRASLFINSDRKPAWAVIHEQQPVVDISLINSVFTYDVVTGAKTDFFDFIDPLQGKILGAARQNIDFVGAVDPAAYNVGNVNNYGKRWADQHVGQIWWDTTNTRFIDPNQGNIVYASRRWAQLFPGSTVEVYQWVESEQPPATYTGEGIPRSITSYAITSRVDASGVFRTQYYFWVSGIRSVNQTAKKTLSTTSISRYIENPRSSGIPYVAFINAATTALYNATDIVSAQDTILSIEFDREYTDDNVHVEYELIPQDRGDGFLSAGLYKKLQDSFCGIDVNGNQVPDPMLRPANRYGVQFRPRQSMFVDRFAALENYLGRVNSVLQLYPISESRSFTLLNSQEPYPTAQSGEWNQRVANLEELSYQNLGEVPVGYRYLVESDSGQQGLWTIYSVTASKTYNTLELYRVQNYDTSRYWNYVNWYAVGYNSSINPIAEVNVVSEIATLQLPLGSSVKVRSNSQGKFEIYQLDTTGWNRVGLEDGTIQFKQELWNYSLGRFGFDSEVFDAQYFDQEPVIETRKIIQAINEELLIGDLLIERNRALVLMFNFILSETIAPEWLVKTSLVDVDHRIRQLLPYQVYNRDNQEFVIDYIQEVKPYHVQVREFNLIYDGFDVYTGSMTDFDVPAYWDSNLAIPQFVSPILTPYTLSTALGTGRASTISDTSPGNDLWTQEPWTQWYENYSLQVTGVTVINGGSGYTLIPTVTVVGATIDPPILEAQINAAGQVVSVTVVYAGSGYLTTPTITISGGGGSGATVVPVMGNQKVRQISTRIKFDRYQYDTDIVDWQPNIQYFDNTLVRHLDQVWAANSGSSSGVQSATFNPEQWILVPASTLNGIDRTRGYYVPTVNQTGLDLPLLIDGIDYPGVNVKGVGFDASSGFDVGKFDQYPFDNVILGPEGRPTYDPSILDAIYESSFLDLFLGTRPSDINVDGGQFVDTYSSHAPEELVPGSEFDTLDFRVYTQVPEESEGTLNFRIFQDMRGVQSTYRITPATTTTLANSIEIFDNIIYVDDASRLPVPNINANIWGIIMVNGERIAYREINLSNNSITSFMRGTAGTAVQSHLAGAVVTSMGVENLMPTEYQNRYVDWTGLTDGASYTFTSDIDLDAFTLPFVRQAVEIYVGGTKLYSGYNINTKAPVSVTFNELLPAGLEVLIRVRQGQTWYELGVSEPSNGVELLLADTPAARFLRGL
jgi:hypothetical protein